MISLLQTADAVVVAEQTRMGLWQLFMSGGWLMWVLLILGGLTIFIFVERFMAIRKASEFDMNFMNRIRDYILDGKVAAAVDLCRKTNTPIARMIEKGIGRIGRPMSDVQSAIENVANLEVSKLENGLPSRSMPFSIMRAIGVSVLRQRSTAAAILPSRMKSRMRFMKFMSSVEALRIARNRSTKMKIVTPPRISSGHISQPPLVNNSHKPIRASSVAATSAACKNVIITYAKLFI